MLDHGWDAFIACQPGSPLLREARTLGVPADGVPMARATDLTAFRRLRRLMKERLADVVHTHSSVDSWLGGLAARSLRVPVVRSRHVTIPIKRALVYRLANRVIASGERAGALVGEAGVRRSHIVSIPAGVDVTRFHPGVSGKTVRDELGLSGQVVGLVANVRGSKGHRYFLEAARQVLDEAPGTRFVIAGDGVGFDDVQRRVHEMGLDHAVTMTGFRRDVPEVLAALDVLTLPSIKSEAVSQVLLQALAIGTPIVASNIGGSPELIRDGETGRLVPPEDGTALAAAILDLLRHPERAREMAQAGQRMVHQEQSLDAVMARTTAVYLELIGH